MCGIDGCDLSIDKNNKCILHSDDKNKNIKEFWKEIRNKISFDIKCPNFFDIEKTITFEQIYFPKFETNFLFSSKQSNNSFFHKEKMIFELKVIFKNCIFFEEANFQKIRFKKGLSFENCIFEKGLNFKDIIFQINSKVRIQNCSKITNANFENTTFKDLADFYGSTFQGSLNFERTNFENISVFTKVNFKEDVDFKYTTFGRLAQFKETIFEKKLNLEDTIIKEEINFLKVKTSNDENLKVENIENRETARIIKHSFEKQDNIIEANKYYALEMEKKEKELTLKKHFFEWIIFKFHKIFSNHSQDWFLVLLWIISISYIFYFIKINTVYWIDEFLGFTFSLILLIFIYSYLIRFRNYLGKIYLISIFLLGSFSSLTNINEISNLINPFSIMTKGEDLTFSMLVYKSVIAYLIYQFIISIRQNTRRK